MSYEIVEIAKEGRTITERHRNLVRTCIVMGRIRDAVAEKGDAVRYYGRLIEVENKADFEKNWLYIAPFKDKCNASNILLQGNDYSISKAKNRLDEILRR
jgi:hypothetical protein